MTYNETRLKERVARARLAKNRGTKYKLGKGGFDPSASSPAQNGQCDCSGFVAWVLGMRRDQINAKKWWSRLLPWIETTMVYRDATGPRRVFTRIKEPVAGCIVVYGDRGGSEGHIGVVTKVSYIHGAGYDIDVVDCSSGQSRRTGEAITERDGGFFIRSGAIFAVLNEDIVSK